MASTMNTFTCNNCNISFGDVTAQRLHFKSESHRLSLKRHIDESQRLLSSDENVNSHSATQPLALTKTKNDLSRQQVSVEELLSIRSNETDQNQDGHSDDQESQQSTSMASYDIGAHSSQLTVLNCLFCPQKSNDVPSNLRHMNQSHSFLIPCQSQLIHLETFLRFLYITVSAFNECIYCGVMEDSMHAIQQHMLGKAHCKVNITDGPIGSEYREFYDFGNSEDSEHEDDGEGVDHKSNTSSANNKGLLNTGDDRVRLPSGKTLFNRSVIHGSLQHDPRHVSYSQRRQPKTKPTRTDTIEPDAGTLGDVAASTMSTVDPDTDKRPETQVIARRTDITSLAGVSDHQKRVLRATEKKIIGIEIRAKNRHEAVVGMAANKQKHYRLEHPVPQCG